MSGEEGGGDDGGYVRAEEAVGDVDVKADEVVSLGGKELEGQLAGVESMGEVGVGAEELVVGRPRFPVDRGGEGADGEQRGV